MKVLVGVDGSEHSMCAVALVGKLVASPHDKIGLYYSPPRVKIDSAGDDVDAAMKQVRETLAQGVFAKAREQLPADLRDSVHTIVGTHSPRKGLLLAAEQWRADMIAVGARGLGPLASLLLGSVASRVAQAATVPVLVVRAKPDSTARQAIRVLVPYDGSDSSGRTAALIKKLQWPNQSVGQTLTVIQPMTLGPVPHWIEEQVRDQQTEEMAQAWKADHEQERAKALERLVAFSDELPQLFQKSEPTVAEGHISEEILKAIDVNDIDLVAIGAHGHGLWQRFVTGSVSETILGHASCSVLLVRDVEQP